MDAIGKTVDPEAKQKLRVELSSLSQTLNQVLGEFWQECEKGTERRTEMARAMSVPGRPPVTGIDVLRQSADAKAMEASLSHISETVFIKRGPLVYAKIVKGSAPADRRSLFVAGLYANLDSWTVRLLVETLEKACAAHLAAQERPEGVATVQSAVSVVENAFIRPSEV